MSSAMLAKGPNYSIIQQCISLVAGLFVHVGHKTQQGCRVC